MNLKKKQLALAIVAAFTTGAASATIDMPNNADAVDFDTSISVPTNVNTTSDDILEAETNLGFSITGGTAKYIRFDILGTATWAAVVAAADLIGFAAGEATVSQGGSIGSNFVIFEVNPVTDYDQAAIISLAGKMVKVVDQSENRISYGLYETANDAVNQTNSLSAQTAKYFGWSQGYEVSCTVYDEYNYDIDVARPWLFEDDETYSYPFNATMRALDNVYNADATEVSNDDYFSAGTMATVNGSYVGIDRASWYYTLGIAADNMSASWTQNPSDINDYDFYVRTKNDPNEPMVPTDWNLVIDPSGDVYDLDEIDLGVCGSTKYSGSRDRMDFGLTPNGNFQMWVRVTNPSDLMGPVVFQVWNDAGDSSTFDMGDIAGVASSDLAAYSATDIIDINDVYAAAQAANPSFDVNGGKLRIEVRGGFGTDAKDGPERGAEHANRAENGIHITALTISKDGTSFFVTKP